MVGAAYENGAYVSRKTRLPSPIIPKKGGFSPNRELFLFNYQQINYLGVVQNLLEYQFNLLRLRFIPEGG